MTFEEAKEQLRELIFDTESLIVGDAAKGIYCKDLEALKKAVEVFEKQIPRKPLGGIDFAGNEYKICCDCSAIVQDGEWRANYCPDCGQVLDWSEKI